MGIFETDVATGTVFWNDELEQIFGYQPGTFDRQLSTWQKHVHPDDRARVLAEFSKAVSEQRSSLAYCYRMRRVDGQIRYIEASVAFQYDSEGRNTRRLGANVDVTDRVIQEARWRALFDEMHEGFAACELIRDGQGEAVDFRFLEVNARCEALTGLPAAKVVGQRAYELMEGLEPYWLQKYARVVETGEPENFTAYASPLNKWFEVHTYRYATDRFAAVFLDVTDKKQVEAEAAKARQRALQASRLGVMGAMASTLAHELNQPLGAAANYLSVAGLKFKEFQGGAKGAEDPVRLAHAEVLRAGQIIRKIRQFTVEGHIERTSVELMQVIEEAASEAFSQQNASDILLTLELPGPGVKVLGNAVQLQQVFSNLIRNAITAMQEQEGPKQITVHARKRLRHVLVTVSDTGPGVEPHRVERIFDAFESSSTDGLGLGLALCRTIVEALDGTIMAESSQKGGKFVLTIPIAE